MNEQTQLEAKMMGTEGKSFQNWFKVLSNLATDVLLKATPEGITAKLSDKAAVAVLELELPVEGWTSYDLKADEELLDEEIEEIKKEVLEDYEDYSLEDLEEIQHHEITEEDEEETLEEIQEKIEEEKKDRKQPTFTFGVDTEDVANFLKTLGTPIEFEVTDSKLKLESGKMNYKVPLLSLSGGEVPNTSRLEHDTEVEIDTGKFFDYIGKAGKVSDSFLLERQESSLLIKGDSDNASFKADFGLENLQGSEENYASRYPTEYMDKIKPVKKIADEIKILLAEDYPIKIVGDNFKYVVAPRVEE